MPHSNEILPYSRVGLEGLHLILVLQVIRLLFSNDFSIIISLEYFSLSYIAKGEK